MTQEPDEIGTENGAGKANAIEKALQLLMQFLPNNTPMGTSELSRLTGFHTATTSRILITLLEHGFLRQDPSSRRFSLGESIVKLSIAVGRSLRSGLIAHVKPFLDRLSISTGQTVTLETIVAKGTILACVVEGPKIIRVAGQTGETLPWNVAAGLRSMLAHFPEDEIEKFIQAPMETFTPNTINTVDKYRAALIRAKRKGYSFEEGEFFKGINAIGAPIFGWDNKPVAAICLVGMADEVNDSKKELIKELLATAKEVSELNFSHAAPR